MKRKELRELRGALSSAHRQIERVKANLDVLCDLMHDIEKELRDDSLIGEKQIMSIRDVARESGRCYHTVYNWVKSEKIKHHTKENGRIYFNRDEIREVL